MVWSQNFLLGRTQHLWIEVLSTDWTPSVREDAALIRLCNLVTEVMVVEMIVEMVVVVVKVEVEVEEEEEEKVEVEEEEEKMEVEEEMQEEEEEEKEEK
ncbi:hypothetical protein M8J77_012204 [Diaphorina citri]|nr:hypothetical protein M8J77_012204 [Diaphorina citri]